MTELGVSPFADDCEPDALDTPALTVETVAAIRRVGRKRHWTKERVLDTLREHGSTYSTAGGGLRRAAETLFGSWAKACVAAGIEPPKRGRPRRTG